jgi:hypothetical protein
MKPKKSRKPNKTKGEARIDKPAAVEITQSRHSSKKGKPKANRVTVEVLLPLPVHHPEQDPAFSMERHDRKEKVVQEETMEEDELNILDGFTDTLNTPIAGPSSLKKGNKLAPTDAHIIAYDNPFEKPSRSSKRKAKKRKDIEEADDASPNTTSSDRKMASSSKESRGDVNIQSPSNAYAKKRKRNGLELKKTCDPTQEIRAVKSNGRMTIASDDEEDDIINPPVTKEPPSPSPTSIRDKRRKGKQKAPSDDIQTDAANTTDHDRNVLKVGHL